MVKSLPRSLKIKKREKERAKGNHVKEQNCFKNSNYEIEAQRKLKDSLKARTKNQSLEMDTCSVSHTHKCPSNWLSIVAVTIVTNTLSAFLFLDRYTMLSYLGKNLGQYGNHHGFDSLPGQLTSLNLVSQTLISPLLCVQHFSRCYREKEISINKTHLPSRS